MIVRPICHLLGLTYGMLNRVGYKAYYINYSLPPCRKLFRAPSRLSSCVGPILVSQFSALLILLYYKPIDLNRFSGTYH
jgi:hypothetical protein